MCGLMGPAALALLAWRVYQSALSLTDSFVEAGLLLLFAYASLVPYAQLTLYAVLDASGKAGAYFDSKVPLPGQSTPALVKVCWYLMGKDSPVAEKLKKLRDTQDLPWWLKTSA